jgi:CubicO group peptidase (beta-lactamase class C family)
MLFSGLIMIAAACGSVSEPDKAINRLVETEVFNEAVTSRIAETLALYPNHTQFAIAFVEGDDHFFYGAQRNRDTLQTIDNYDRVFESGSITKVFTSALLAIADEEGVVRANGPVQDILDFDLNEGNDITFLQLSNHTSGLSRVPPMLGDIILNFRNPYRRYSEERFRNYLSKDMSLDSDPGIEYAYSNTGSGLLGYALSQAYGTSYSELISEKIFSPLGMTRTTTDREIVKEFLVEGRNSRGRITPVLGCSSPGRRRCSFIHGE